MHWRKRVSTYLDEAARIVPKRDERVFALVCAGSANRSRMFESDRRFCFASCGKLFIVEIIVGAFSTKAEASFAFDDLTRIKSWAHDASAYSGWYTIYIYVYHLII